VFTEKLPKEEKFCFVPLLSANMYGVQKLKL
jgi:hypothetical protein